ncbi:hypothetical protein Sta7437_3572 [Stanieria cyanosphaera PCC 7437]|uniref:Uncharacterized protein n=1 Tax=Stanieria cyanosphaera (strain ATCC 29371 / PCC 7437) TaxID=111780 RepID=K9XWV1_STAC7|nr:hypothetical protein [Stanieria cyanosphaera]AFZ37070.1 hypothetical protein Sta7437_3572 [Stanieria cyanosphaera PCC 7437]
MNELSKEEMRQRLGNISHLQDLLFGDKIETYENQFEQLAQRLNQLELQLKQFQVNVGDRLIDLQNSLTKKMDASVSSLEKKLKYLSLTSHEEINQLRQEIQATAKLSSENIALLRKNLNQESYYLKHELTQTRETAEENIKSLRQQVFEKIEKSLSDLTDAKVSRADLAEVLFELCLKVKGSEFVPDLKEAVENQVKADFILPEEADNNLKRHENNL